MKNTKKIFMGVLVVAIIGLGFWYFQNKEMTEEMDVVDQATQEMEGERVESEMLVEEMTEDEMREFEMMGEEEMMLDGAEG